MLEKLAMLEVKVLGIYEVVLEKGRELVVKVKEVFWAIVDKVLLFGHKYMG